MNDVRSGRILIIGAGVIGLMTAWRLRSGGYDVVIIDPQPGAGATFAAAGMLAPHSEIAVGEETNYSLQRDALVRWRDVVELLTTQGFEAPALNMVGTLIVGVDGGDRRLLSQHVAVMKSFGAAFRLLERVDHPESFAHLADNVREGVLVPDEAWVNPDDVVRTLRNALIILGVPTIAATVEHVTQGTPVTVVAGGETHAADAVIVSTGASAVPGLTDAPRVRPIRGITTRLMGVDRMGLPMVRAFVHGRPFYYVGRQNGYGVIGASAEERSDQRVELGESYRLLRDALEVLPALDGATVLETRVGLRPVSEDATPFFVQLAPGAIAVSNGHYRHGVTLAPLASSWALEWVRALS